MRSSKCDLTTFFNKINIDRLDKNMDEGLFLTFIGITVLDDKSISESRCGKYYTYMKWTESIEDSMNAIPDIIREAVEIDMLDECLCKADIYIWHNKLTSYPIMSGLFSSKVTRTYKSQRYIISDGLETEIYALKIDWKNSHIDYCGISNYQKDDVFVSSSIPYDMLMKKYDLLMKKKISAFKEFMSCTKDKTRDIFNEKKSKPKDNFIIRTWNRFVEYTHKVWVKLGGES